MNKEVIVPEGVHKARGYSHAIKVGNAIYVAGQVGVDEGDNIVGGGDCAAQATQAFENLKRVLEAAGASLRDVVKLTIFVKSFDDIGKVREARRKYFSDYFPASTMVVISSLALAELLVEVEAVAVI